jgi:flagellar hook assembly protein FlgD
VAGSAEVAVVLYDLRGGRIGEVFRGPATSGQFQMEWDGRDQGGTLLDPGIYILRVEVDTDRGIQARERIVSLAY